MHPSQLSGFRKTIIVCLTIAFAGALLIFTAMANLNLLKSVYPDPQFYMFGLLALEGGVVYWTGYYLLHLAGIHKGIAVIALAVDAFLSGTGFFYEMETMTGKIGTITLPPVIVIVAFAVLFNVAMALISHLVPMSGSGVQPKGESAAAYADGYQQRSLAQTATIDKGPGLLSNAAASALATGMDLKEQAKEKLAARKESRAQAKAAAQPVAVSEEQEAKN